MKPIKAKKDFTIGEEYFFVGDTIELNKLDYEQIVKLNEKGFIEPLTMKELIEMKKNKNNFNKKEEEIWQVN